MSESLEQKCRELARESGPDGLIDQKDAERACLLAAAEALEWAAKGIEFAMVYAEAQLPNEGEIREYGLAAGAEAASKNYVDGHRQEAARLRKRAEKL